MSGSFSRGRASYDHDVRITKTKNVDKERSSDNLVIEDNIKEFIKQGMSQKEAVEAFINREMQPYIDEYNSKQKREDRKIKVPYCDYWKTNDKINGGKMLYEFVGQIGEHKTNGTEYYDAKGVEKEVLKALYQDTYENIVKEFKEKYPHMKVLWCTVHLDEPNGTPHFHIACVPIGEGYKQGLSHQVSIGNALACDGIERAKTRQEGFQMTRMYDDIITNTIKPKIEMLFPDAEIKEVIHGRLHKTRQEWEAEKEQLKNYVKEFFEQQKRQATLEAKTPTIARDRVFGVSRKIQEEVEKMVSMEQEASGDEIKAKMDEWDKELTRIENVQNEPIDDPMELIADDDFEY